MLSALRAFSQTWVAKILFGILIVSFGAFGISNVISDIGTNTVARVGDQEITLRDYQRAYQTQLNQVAQQFGTMPTTDQATAMGIPGMVLGQLAADAAINQMAVSLGIGVSDARLAKMLRDDPTFAGTLGNFDPSSFQQVLQQNGYTEGDYFELQKRAARRQQLAAGLFADANVPKAAIELVNRYAGDTRTLDYFVLNGASMDIPTPTEDDLAAYLTAHQAQFRTKETRTADVMLLSPETLAATQTIPDDQIAAEYDRVKASMTKPERRTIQQVVLPDDAAKAAFDAGKAAGKSLADLAKENNLAVTELGVLAKSDVTDSALADAAFALAQGQFTIIPGATGQRAIGVSAIDPGGTPALADVSKDIANNLALTAARKQVLDTLDQIEELRAAFQPLADIGKRFNLPVAEVVLSGQGAAFDGGNAPKLSTEEMTKASTAIFAAEQGKLAPTLALAANRNLWFDLKKVEPARDQTLAEVHDAVAAAWTAEKADAAEAAEAQKIVDQLKAGTSFDDVAMSLSQFPVLSPAITRQGDGTPVIDANVATAVFDGGPGHVGTAKNGDGDYVVFKVNDISAPAADNAQATSYVENGARDTLFADFVGGVRNDYGVHENQSAISQLLAPNGQ